MHLLEGAGGDDVWRAAASRIIGRQGTLEQPSRLGATVELLHVAMVVHDPRDRWVVSRRPPMNPAFALAEVVWILSGRDDSGFLNFWNPKLPTFAGTGPTYYGAYGHRLRHRFGLDQLRNAFETLHADPDSRQVVLQIWDASADLPLEQGTPRGDDIPCNVCSLLKIREGRLEWVQVMRSNDLKLGLPHNLVQFTMLQEMMAGWLGCAVGDYTHFSDSLHVYDAALKDLLEPSAITRETNTDTWRLSYEETLAEIHEISDRMDIMRRASIDRQTLSKAAYNEQLSRPSRNILAIVGADAARRHKLAGLDTELAAACMNPCLRQLWSRWLARKVADRTPPSSRRRIPS